MEDEKDRSKSEEPQAEASDRPKNEARDETGGEVSADIDARVEILISDDLLTARAQSIQPHGGEGRPLSEDLVRRSLTEEGVTCGILDEAVAMLVESYRQSGTCDTELVLAQGDPPREGRPGTVKPVVEPGAAACVFSGNVFARLVPTRQPEPGRDLTGSPIHTQAELPEVRIVAGEHCRVSEDGGEAIATAYGEPRVEGEQASVQSGIRLIEGGLICLLDIFPIRMTGRAPTDADLIGALEASGVRLELMDLEAVRSALQVAITERAPQPDICAARGVAPEPGRDGQILFTVDIEDRVGTLDDRGRIDFKEQNRLHRVHKDDQIATVIPHTNGKPGIGVSGQEIPAIPGRPVELRLGPGAREEDGNILANRGGALVVQGPSIDVSNSFRVAGDVDYHSGNITNDSGSVFVEGSVLAGFRVTAGSDIEIGQSIDGGTVETAGNLIVKHAIIGKEGAGVRAAGHIRAEYVQNADVIGSGDLTVDRELIQSRVKISGILRMTGMPGAIVGGELEADGGIVTKELGSSSGAPTIVRIGHGTRQISQLRDALNAKLEPLQQIRTRLGTESGDELLDRLSRMIETAEAEYEEVQNPALAAQLARLKERRGSLRKLLRLQSELETECSELEQTLAQAEKNREKQVSRGTPACVEVKGHVYPGVVFMIDGATFPVSQAYSAVRFFYNIQKRRVEARRNF